MNESSIGGREQMAHFGSDTTMYLKEIEPFLGFPGGSEVKAPACNAGDQGSIPGLRRPPGEGNGYHSSILAWKIPRTEEPGRL